MAKGVILIDFYYFRLYYAANVKVGLDGLYPAKIYAEGIT